MAEFALEWVEDVVFEGGAGTLALYGAIDLIEYWYIDVLSVRLLDCFNTFARYFSLFKCLSSVSVSY
jgi:hypothetical protein